MPLITFINYDGTVREVHAAAGTTVMQSAVDNGIDEILAECGGACSCATCHCYVDDAWLEKVSTASSIEKDMLACVLNPLPNSRLSCQITVNDSLDGLVINLPEQQY